MPDPIAHAVTIGSHLSVSRHRPHRLFHSNHNFAASSEAGHTKYITAHYPVAEEAEVFIGEHPEDFNGVRQTLLSNPGAVVLFQLAPAYPCLANQTSPVLRLVLIDGTWRKAKIWMSNPWLQQLGLSHR